MTDSTLAADAWEQLAFEKTTDRSRAAGRDWLAEFVTPPVGRTRSETPHEWDRVQVQRALGSSETSSGASVLRRDLINRLAWHWAQYLASKQLRPLREYLDRYTTVQPLLREKTARCALALVARLQAHVPNLPVPDACPAPDGVVVLSWDADEHHLSAFVDETGSIEWFYRNRNSGALWECVTELEAALDRAAAKVRLFAVAD